MAILAKVGLILVGIFGVLLLMPAGRLAVFGITGGKFELGAQQFNLMIAQTLIGVLLVAGSLLVLKKIDK